ncbi:MAG: hypothetical protein JWM97_587 [Phycisphaerales bacterium]|nr:hypothetical protein [Phycisphaerales bacterium]
MMMTNVPQCTTMHQLWRVVRLNSRALARPSPNRLMAAGCNMSHQLSMGHPWDISASRRSGPAAGGYRRRSQRIDAKCEGEKRDIWDTFISGRGLGAGGLARFGRRGARERAGDVAQIVVGGPVDARQHVALEIAIKSSGAGGGGGSSTLPGPKGRRPARRCPGRSGGRSPAAAGRRGRPSRGRWSGGRGGSG